MDGKKRTNVVRKGKQEIKGLQQLLSRKLHQLLIFPLLLLGFPFPPYEISFQKMIVIRFLCHCKTFNRWKISF